MQCVCFSAININVSLPTYMFALSSTVWYRQHNLGKTPLRPGLPSIKNCHCVPAPQYQVPNNNAQGEMNCTSKLAGLPSPLFIPLPGVPIRPASFAARRIWGGIKLKFRMRWTCWQSCSSFSNLTGSWGGRGSPFWNCSQRCMATQNSSVFNFPVCIGYASNYFNENVLHRPSLSMSARFQTPARVCCARPVPKRRFLACTAASWPVLGAEKLDGDQL